jgi:hypothetical protein
MSDLTLKRPVDVDSLADEMPADLPPDDLKRQLGELIRRYVLDGRSTHLANRVIRHCQALYLHPALGDRPDEQDAFRTLAQHWQRLTQISRSAMGVDEA